MYEGKEYDLEYSDAAKEKSEAWWQPLLYQVPVVVTRPTADGGTETLPERIAIQAVCLMPRSDAGKAEGLEGVKAILKELGVPGLGEASADAGAPAPEEEEPSWARAALAWARDRLSPRPLSATQRNCPVRRAEDGECAIMIEEIMVETKRPIIIRCPTGFDFEATTMECAYTGIPIVGGGGGGGGGSSGGGGGEGGEGGEGETGTRTVEFTLTCSGSVARGSGGGCGVSAPDSAGVNMGALKFAWSSSTTGATKSGKGLSAWNGTATETATVAVTVTDPAGTIAAFSDDETITVKARAWTFRPPTPASASSGYGGANWDKGKWGQHDSGSTTVPGVLAGGGPWEGRYTGDAPPVHNGDNAITLHSDFDVTGSAYSGANGVACFAATDSATVANVVAVNDACGTSSRLSSWEGMALAHEAAHATAGDKCLNSKTTSDKIKELERITGDDVEEVRKELHETWNNFWEQTVAPAFEGRLSTPTSPVFWEYRFLGSWNRHAVMGGREGGTNGC